MFRVRDPTASLDNEIDVVIVMQVSVWLLAGLWLAIYLRQRGNWNALHWGKLQTLSLIFIGILGLSTISSVAPSLTAFKVFQMLVSMMFTLVFVERYGTEQCLEKLFWFSFVLCVAVGILAIVAPELVNDVTETGATRLRGELIAPTGAVSMLAFILLVGWMRHLGKPFFIGALLVTLTLLILSLERTAYVAIVAFILLAWWNSRGTSAAKWIMAGVLIPFGLFMAFGGMDLLAGARSSESVWTLSDRVGLWAYLSALTMNKAPWTGLGYYSASRLYGPEYNPGLGTAHSMFVEAFVGAGLPALIALIVLVIVLIRYGMKMLSRKGSNYSTVTVSLLVGVLLYGVVGAAMETGAIAITFWAVISIVSVHFQKKTAAEEEPNIVIVHNQSLTDDAV